MASMLAAVALSGLAGCDGDKSKAQAAADAGALDAGPALPVVGGKLGAELAEAAKSGGHESRPAPGGAKDGPPENGVFSPQAAAAVLPKDVPYTIEVIDAGSEPRAQLAAKVDPKSEQKVAMTLGLRMGGPQGLPNLELGLSLKADKPADKPKEGAPAAPTKVTAKITSATLASMSIGGPPKELADALAKLKGSALRYDLSPANVVSNQKPELAKDADPGLQPLLAALGEAITLLTPPLPDKPVGAGAYWMVTDRAVVSGAQLPVLRYRVFKIEKVEGDVVSFSVDTRQYAEGADLKLPGPNGDVTLTIDRLDSAGKGTLTWSPSSYAPGTADASQRLQALLVPPGASGPGAGGQQAAQRSVAQVELTAKIAPPAAQ
ncbi:MULTISPECIES: hypothetical protein [Sorangium]|uniref:Uncharacterized protein n=1 Tax=Sorangium cellulosum TaxID=56 RepID=A0A4P2QKZ9_SORCE|nr:MULTISPECIES: hypothetical protein [Sorangium]AUX30456.1 hypothetical protein SOCE836_025600 [Sorangium cellulosum]WCQ89851.1 hypothetical protein NQZ70_02544 [Sorangium sp. Soce836]